MKIDKEYWNDLLKNEWDNKETKEKIKEHVMKESEKKMEKIELSIIKHLISWNYEESNIRCFEKEEDEKKYVDDIENKSDKQIVCSPVFLDSIKENKAFKKVVITSHLPNHIKAFIIPDKDLNLHVSEVSGIPFNVDISFDGSNTIMITKYKNE